MEGRLFVNHQLLKEIIHLFVRNLHAAEHCHPSFP